MTVRWGVLSTAKIAREKVIPGMQAAEGSEILAIAGRDIDRARSVASALGIPRAHDSYDDLLADPELDAVYVPLPNHMHAEWTIAAARAGKHVLCEKPLALTSDDAQRMVDVCAQENVVFMEAFMYRLHPSWVAVRDLVASGRIGELTAIQSWFSYFNDDQSNIRNIAEYGGGALMDIGCYPINLSRMLFGQEPTGVRATIARDSGSGVDVLTAAILEFDDRLATFTCSIRTEPDQRVHVVGTEGRISVEIPFNIPPDRPTRVFVTAGGDPPTAPATQALTFEAADQYAIEVEAFGRAVESGAPVPIPPGDGVANMRVIEAVAAAGGAA